jgi:methylthioribose-1-phosphate isomerase
MNVEKKNRSIWRNGGGLVQVIDQRKLPHSYETMTLDTVDRVVLAIREMVVRGAPLIGVTGAWGVVVALGTTTDEAEFLTACRRIREARPTAVNLAWAVDRMLAVLRPAAAHERRAKAEREALAIEAEEVENCRRIGEHGAVLIERLAAAKPGSTVNILTHCNAGWLACVEHGTATAPIYEAHRRGIPVQVWVDETRPLNQGARLTAWEMGRAGVPHTVICDNAGGHLMQHGRVDLAIVGTDRTTCTGDVANKIGTYLKALAARDNNIPFYVALPSSTFDWTLRNGVKEIPIEERDADEIRYIQGLGGDGLTRVLVPGAASPASNPAFDVTPARLVTGFITERGVCAADEQSIRGLFPEKKK